MMKNVNNYKHDYRWFGDGWVDRDTWPNIEIEFSLAPWAWSLKPRLYIDDLSWYGTWTWLFLKLTFYSNGGRKDHDHDFDKVCALPHCQTCQAFNIMPWHRRVIRCVINSIRGAEIEK